MKLIRNHVPGERYQFDNGKCSSANGYAQVDTSQDASYFGTWANPFTFTIFCYAEGDTTERIEETAEEFAAAMLDLKMPTPTNPPGHYHLFLTMQ